MKLTKKILLKATRLGLIKLGYQEVKDTITGADGLFAKRISPDFFLSLGFTKSRFYDSRFTADFYFSKTTLWGATWGDIPPESYERIGVFLTQEERNLYLDEEFRVEGLKDAWWRGDSNLDFYKFLEVVKISEKRFLEQENLYIKVENSSEIIELKNHVLSVFQLIDKGVSDNFKYNFLPEKNIDDIPIEWFKAAEITLKNEKAILNINTVKRLAGDAWRQKSLV